LRLPRILVLVSCSGVLLVQQANAGSFGFVPGHYYSANGLYGGGATILEYDQSGHTVGLRNMDWPTDFGRLAFGPDGNLYATAYYYDGQLVRQDILSLNDQFEVQEHYALPAGLRGAEIVFDNAGHFYWGNAQFDIGEPDSGRRFLPDNASLEAILPDGHFLVVQDRSLRELDAERNFLREVLSAQRPAANVAYDPHTRMVFASGRMNNESWIWSINFDSGELVNSIRWQASDLFMTKEGRLLASRFNSSPALFSSDLVPILHLNSFPEAITQFVPEPATRALAILGLCALVFCRGLLHARPKCDRAEW
jgi:hypothetical protein